MTETCDHCEHKIGQYTETFDTVDIFKCCHCGRKREQRREPPVQLRSDPWTYKPGDHGPHVPPPNPMWTWKP